MHAFLTGLKKTSNFLQRNVIPSKRIYRSRRQFYKKYSLKKYNFVLNKFGHMNGILILSDVIHSIQFSDYLGIF
jgi:hypothetical protein